MARPPRSPANTRTRPGPQPPLSPAQQRALKAQQRALKIDDDAWRATLAGYPQEVDKGVDVSDRGWPQYGEPCTSSSQLSRLQARQLITRLEVAGAPVGKPYTGHRPADGTGATPTPAQRALIERLRGEINWRVHYDAWLASRYSPTQGRPVRTYQDAEAVIEALRRMRDHQTAAQLRC